MRLAVIFLLLVIFIAVGLTDAEAKTTKFSESLICQPTTECSSIFEVQKGAKATITVSVGTPDNVNFRVEDPNGDNVRLVRAVFPDTQGMTQVLTRIMTAEVTGDYTLHFRDPIPQNFRATVTVSTEDTSPVEIRDIPAAGTPNFKGGCLIATATYGSELSPQVQALREIRDHSLLATQTGTSFMNSFNEFYYLFSPQIADLERQSPAFREVVKVAITPLISSLSILNYVDMDSEQSVLGYGISVILLNVGMYFVTPAIVVFVLKKRI